MRKMLMSKITIICLAIITVLEITILGELNSSGLLWIMYGMYKLITLK